MPEDSIHAEGGGGGRPESMEYIYIYINILKQCMKARSVTDVIRRHLFKDIAGRHITVGGHFGGLDNY